MADGNGYDSTNSGVIFTPYQDQQLSGQGKLNINGHETRYVLVKERLTRDGPAELVLYERAGVLFKNDRSDNERAPAFSGPLDRHKDLRVAAWPGQKDGRRYMSLKVSARQGGGQGQQQQQQQQDDGWGGGYDDEIPF